MKNISESAKHMKEHSGVFHTKYPTYEGKVLGGLHILILMSCGPMMTNESHCMGVIKLVTEYFCIPSVL
jgi:hypothetical protein